MSAILENYMTVDELAKEVGRSTRTVRRWALNSVPALPLTYLGRTPLVHRTDAEGWLKGHRVQRNVRRGK